MGCTACQATGRAHDVGLKDESGSVAQWRAWMTQAIAHPSWRAPSPHHIIRLARDKADEFGDHLLHEELRVSTHLPARWQLAGHEMCNVGHRQQTILLAQWLQAEKGRHRLATITTGGALCYLRLRSSLRSDWRRCFVVIAEQHERLEVSHLLHKGRLRARHRVA
eukprot:1985537-Prymnesium_polylepis.1